MVCLMPHWEQNIQIYATSFSLASLCTNSDFSFVEKFWLKPCYIEEPGTVTARVHRELQLRWSLAHCWSHCRLLPHTQHHEVASAPCQAWISSTLLNYQWAVTLTVDSTGGIGPWMLTEVFVMRRSFQGNFRIAVMAFLTVSNPLGLHLKLWK